MVQTKLAIDPDGSARAVPAPPPESPKSCNRNDVAGREAIATGTNPVTPPEDVMTGLMLIKSILSKPNADAATESPPDVYEPDAKRVA